jgi:hypothetical protein
VAHLVHECRERDLASRLSELAGCLDQSAGCTWGWNEPGAVRREKRASGAAPRSRAWLD